MKVAYLFASGRAKYQGAETRTLYRFTPWCEDVDEKDWPAMQAKVVRHTGCCGRPTRMDRVFGSEEEIRQGLVAVQWR